MNAPTNRATQLVDGLADPKSVVPANMVLDYPSERLAEVEKSWKPGREKAAQELALTGQSVEHGHWDWRIKVESVEKGRHRLVAVECSQDIQGLMAILGQGRPARLEPPGKPILYVDYLESAPWNLRTPTSRPRYLGVGTVMIAEAVRLSLEWGWQGRIGLHSLPQAERFYRVTCGMTDLGPDSDYYELSYFEYTEYQAAHWLAKVGLTP